MQLRGCAGLVASGMVNDLQKDAERCAARVRSQARAPAAQRSIRDEMSIRNAEPADAGAIARIHVDGWRHAYREILPASYLQGLSYSQREGNWSKWLSERKLVVQVAEDNGSVIGYIAGSKEGELGKLLGLYINPTFIGKGVGKTLLAQLEADMKPRALLLMVLKGNALGISFYQRNGFAFTGKTEQLQVDGQSFMELEMRRESV